MRNEAAFMTSSWTKDFVEQLSDKEFRHAFMADQVRTHIALAIRILREQAGREWSQTELGRRCGKPQSWISRLEDPEYGKVSLSTLLEIAEAFDLPLLVQFPEWSDWLVRMKDQSKGDFEKSGFDAASLGQFANTFVKRTDLHASFERNEYTLTAAGEKQAAGNDNRVSASVA